MPSSFDERVPKNRGLSKVDLALCKLTENYSLNNRSTSGNLIVYLRTDYDWIKAIIKEFYSSL